MRLDLGNNERRLGSAIVVRSDFGIAWADYIVAHISIEPQYAMATIASSVIASMISSLIISYLFMWCFSVGFNRVYPAPCSVFARDQHCSLEQSI